MNEKDEKRLNTVARIAAPVGLPLLGVSFLLGDSFASRVFLVLGLVVFIGGGFLILSFLLFGALAHLQNRETSSKENLPFHERIQSQILETWKKIRRQSKHLKESAGLKPRLTYDPRVIRKANLIFSANDNGISLTSINEGAKISRTVLAAVAQLGDKGRSYKWTGGEFNSSKPRIEPPMGLIANKDAIHFNDVNFVWKDCSPSNAHDVLLKGKSVRESFEGKKPPGKPTVADSVVTSTSPFFYELSDDWLSTYESLIKEANRATHGAIWYDREVWENLGIERWKGQSGSRYTVDRKKARLRFRTGSGVDVNRDVVSFRFNFEEYAILPDAVVVTGKKLYPIESIEVYTDVRGYVISESKVPKGSEPTGWTWEYVNKNGSPDLRYSENERLAIIDVCEVAITFNKNVIFSVVFSNVTAGQQFANHLVQLSVMSSGQTR